MSKKYSEQEVIDKYQKFQDSRKKFDFIYKENFVNWKGETRDSKKLYSEVIASELLENIFKFEEISTISRETSYKTESHRKIEHNLESNRKEEQFAKRLVGLKFEDLGEVIDFQVPLKNELKDDAGKIDLVSINEKERKVFLIELKRMNRETLLRAILEIYVYSKKIDQGKFLADFFKDPTGFRIFPAVWVMESAECNPYKELIEMREGKRPETQDLSSDLGVQVFTHKTEM